MKKTRKPDPRNKVAAKSTQRRAVPDAPPPADPSGNGNERVVFSKIRATVPLPNLIAVQRSSYDQFLQIDLLPEERVTAGLQAVFTSVFPFSDFRSACELHFVRYELGTWECKCGKLKSLQHLRIGCKHCDARIKAADPREREVVCPACGQATPNAVPSCPTCNSAVGLAIGETQTDR